MLTCTPETLCDAQFAECLGAPQKTARHEDFPVAHLLPARLRSPVLAYYAFARAADDIADHPRLASREKLFLLSALEKSLCATGHLSVGLHLRQVFTDHALPLSFASDLLKAFRQDAERCSGSTLETANELLDYCRSSAVPVGRFLLHLASIHTEEALLASDALCSVLQILNHLQDVRKDWETLHRGYLPLDWFRDAGIEKFDQIFLSQQDQEKFILVQRRTLVFCEPLLDAASPLPALLRPHAPWLSAQAAATISLAFASHRKVCQGDVLKQKIAPNHWDWGRAMAAALRRRICWW